MTEGASMMKPEKTLQLRRDELIRMDGNVAGRVISCRKGILWLTQTGRPGDFLIREGEVFSIADPGVVLISALKDSVYAVLGAKSPLLDDDWPCLAFRRMARLFEAAKKSLLT